MIRRLLSALILAWVIGFVVFVGLLPRPAGDQRTDGIIVLTGGPKRIERGLTLMQAGKAKRMLVSGVNMEVARRDFLKIYRPPLPLFDCCIDLGHEAVDTRSNAAESADWIETHHYRSIRLVTTDWHMRRARFELRQALPEQVAIVTDAVHSEPDLKVLLTEYHKYLLRRAAALAGY
ncbi:YdcF family protein [Sphingomonas sp. MAH-20]|uniref:YdcF family protein n=1 Tax=Sphingomonas horti TaxID=2682842 RepID=A0A6I4IZN9_9SPHN|nr:YdcF family protein [Sphingomonas sp. CGMCC 1.13658]MBA2920628.1 YdcF family protein [Sphingomonas sp. CGMCC 1.13658]MVO77564.1 YdcF family protein [Sphingomonas horti]